VFEVGADGSERLIPYDVRGECVVVHGVLRGLRLRHGSSALCIYNAAPDLRGVATAAGTAPPVVERVLAGRQPCPGRGLSPRRRTATAATPLRRTMTGASPPSPAGWGDARGGWSPSPPWLSAAAPSCSPPGNGTTPRRGRLRPRMRLPARAPR